MVAYRWAWIGGGTAFVTVALVAALWPAPRPVAEVQGQAWDAKDVIAHLRKQGLKFNWQEIAIPSGGARPRLFPCEKAVWIYPDRFSSALEAASHEAGQEDSGQLAETKRQLLLAEGKADVALPSTARSDIVVLMSLQDDQQREAKEAFDLTRTDNTLMHTWGRFVFMGDSQKVTQIKKAL